MRESIEVSAKGCNKRYGYTQDVLFFYKVRIERLLRLGMAKTERDKKHNCLNMCEKIENGECK